MAISEAERSDLYAGLSKAIGPHQAEILMSAIPLHDLDEVATKGDIAELRVEMAELRAGFKTDLGELRATLTNWMLTLFVAIVAAMVGVGFLS